jgi:RNA polymerase sigma-70 factor (ECF subfamily)
MNLQGHRPAKTSDARGFQKDMVALMPQLRAFARVLCHHRELGEDLAQETLVKAWKARSHFEAGTNLKAWLFTILRNEFHSHARRAWRQTHWDEIKGDRIAGAADPQMWSLDLSDTAHALRELPDHQREAVVLVCAGGFSYEDAAQICGAPVGTLKSRVARGRAALIETLDGDRKITRSPSVTQSGGSDDILAQLAALAPACA